MRLLEAKKTRAYLVVIELGQKESHYLEDSLAEMKELVASAGIQIVGSHCAKLRNPSPSQFIREGKLEEIWTEAKKVKANVFVFNVILTPAQGRNIEKVTKINVMDRTGLILEIFGKRAKSSEGKLQVELARLNYVLPRLGGLGNVMSRVGGGIGTRGSGEQELEFDRRKIRRRIQRVKEDLKKVRKHRDLLRSGRKRRNLITVSLVGYTNAGKSTLLNSLTNADTYVEDQLFATLDPKTRVQQIDGRRDVLFVDTVGFLRDLPHSLVEAFHATLEETIHADALIHVLDVSNVERAHEYKHAVEVVLKEIKADKLPQLLALNKVDMLTEEEQNSLKKKWPEAVLISAKGKLGLNALSAKLMSLIEASKEPLPEVAQKEYGVE